MKWNMLVNFLKEREKIIGFDEKLHRYKINNQPAVGVSEFLTGRWYTLSTTDFIKNMWFSNYSEEVETVINWQIRGEMACAVGTRYHNLLERAIKERKPDCLDDFCMGAYEYCIETYGNSLILNEQKYADETIMLCGTADITAVDFGNKIIRIHDFKVVGKPLKSKYMNFDNELGDEACSKHRYYSLQLGCYKFLVYQTFKHVLPDIDDYTFDTKLIVMRKDLYEKKNAGGRTKSHLQILDTEAYFTDFAYDYLTTLKEHKIAVTGLLQSQ